MNNEEIKVGDLVKPSPKTTTWGRHTGLVVGGPFGRQDFADVEHRVFRVFLLSGHLKGDTLSCTEDDLALLSDPERVSR